MENRLRPNKGSKNENQAASNSGIKPKTYTVAPASNNPTFKKLFLDIIEINGYASKETTREYKIKYRPKEVF